MKTNRNRIFPYETGWPAAWRGRPPHLTDQERALAYWWLDHNARADAKVWYDVRIDGVPDSRAETVTGDNQDDTMMRRIWQSLNAKRADLIILQDDRYQIVELRASAGAQTLGELVQYTALARAEWPDLIWLPTQLVTTHVATATARAMEIAGFRIALAPASALYLARPDPRDPLGDGVGRVK